jgi:hypothetical protein
MLGNKAAPGDPPEPRHPILVTSVILPTVAANVAEAEYGAPSMQHRERCLFAIYLLCIPQPTTDVITDNAVAYGIIQILLSRNARSVDIHFHWLRDQVRLGRFAVHWEEGTRTSLIIKPRHEQQGLPRGSTILSKCLFLQCPIIYLFAFVSFLIYLTLLLCLQWYH